MGSRSSGVEAMTERNTLVSSSVFSSRALTLAICSKVSAKNLYGTGAPAAHVTWAAGSYLLSRAPVSTLLSPTLVPPCVRDEGPTSGSVRRR